MKFKSYYWAIIAAAIVVILAISVPMLIPRGSDQKTNPHTPEELQKLQEQAMDYTPQIQAYTDLINANPNDAVALGGLGDVYNGSGKYSEAADWYGKAVTAAPNDPMNYGRLGEAYFAMGMIDVALREFEKGLAVDANNQSILLDMGSVYAQTGKPDEAKKSWQRAYDINPTSRYAQIAQQLLSSPQGTVGSATTSPAP